MSNIRVTYSDSNNLISHGYYILAKKNDSEVERLYYVVYKDEYILIDVKSGQKNTVVDNNIYLNKRHETTSNDTIIPTKVVNVEIIVKER